MVFTLRLDSLEILLKGVKSLSFLLYVESFGSLRFWGTPSLLGVMNEGEMLRGDEVMCNSFFPLFNLETTFGPKDYEFISSSYGLWEDFKSEV